MVVNTCHTAHNAVSLNWRPMHLKWVRANHWQSARPFPKGRRSSQFFPQGFTQFVCRSILREYFVSQPASGTPSKCQLLKCWRLWVDMKFFFNQLQSPALSHVHQAKTKWQFIFLYYSNQLLNLVYILSSTSFKRVEIILLLETFFLLFLSIAQIRFLRCPCW